MTKEIAQEIIKILKNTGGFVAEQAPDVVNQYLTFQIKMTSIYLGISGFICTVILVFFLIWIVLSIKDKWYDDISTFTIAGTFINLIPFFWFLCELRSYIMIRTAPKVFVLEWLKTFTS